MRQTMMVLLLLALTGCSVTVESPPCDDAGTVASDDANVDDASIIDQRIGAIDACGWIGGIYGRKFLEGNLADCTQEACPFPYDRTGRTDVRCDTAEVEACVRELEGGANDCATYTLAMERCAVAAESCR
jgi:hypothetical protein